MGFYKNREGRITIPAWVILIFCSGVLVQSCTDGKAPQSSSIERISKSSEVVTTTYIANEGVLITAGDEKVLIDALHRPYLKEYLATADSTINFIMSDQPPFDGVDVLLVSHPHGDHFHGDLVAEYLSKHPSVKLITSEEVRDSLKSSDLFSTVENQIVFFPYRPFQADSIVVDDMIVRLFHMHHSGYKESQVLIQNMAFLVTLGGRTILHLGDTGFEAEVYEAYDFAEFDIDLGLIPDWLLAYREGRSIVKKHLPCQKMAAIHVSPNDSDQQVKRIQRRFPGATIFKDPGQGISL